MIQMALFELSRLGKIIKKNINMTAEEYIASKRHEDYPGAIFVIWYLKKML